MIGKVVRGDRVAGLLHYLFGPGRANEHSAPHLAAAWDPPAGLKPAVIDGKHDLRELTSLLQQPLLADFRIHSKPVWHCAIRVAPQDRQLTDDEWDEVAREVLHRTGLAPRGDAGGCRWVAVRHADDHIHLVVTLARQDVGPVSTSNDFYRVGEACRDMEQRLSLQRTGATDRTAGSRPTRGETEKAQRAGRTEAPRVLLRRAVHSAAAVTTSPEAFVAELRAAGVLVRERRSELDPTAITGFAVAWPGDQNAEGDPVWFGGSKLAPELSWARLTARWAPSPTAPTPGAGTEPGLGPADDAAHLTPGGRRTVLVEATQAAHTARAHLAAGGSEAAGADDVAAAGADLIAVVGRMFEGRGDGPVSRAADRVQRAARVPWGRPAVRSPTADALRIAARALARAGRPRRREGREITALLRATMSLVDALADLRTAQGRLEQAQAARDASTLLRGTAATLRVPAADGAQPSSGHTARAPRPHPARGQR